MRRGCGPVCPELSGEWKIACCRAGRARARVPRTGRVARRKYRDFEVLIGRAGCPGSPFSSAVALVNWGPVIFQ